MFIVCGLNDELNLQVGRMLSNSLDMFLLELEKLVEYDVSCKQDIIEKVSVDYLKELERNSVKNASTFENTVVVASYNIFALNNNYNFFKQRSISIYLRQPKNLLKNQKNVEKLNLINFDGRDKKLKQICDYVIKLENNNVLKIFNKIIKQLKEVLL